jgi:hypothetical protein
VKRVIQPAGALNLAGCQLALANLPHRYPHPRLLYILMVMTQDTATTTAESDIPRLRELLPVGNTDVHHPQKKITSNLYRLKANRTIG